MVWDGKEKVIPTCRDRDDRNVLWIRCVVYYWSERGNVFEYVSSVILNEVKDQVYIICVYIYKERENAHVLQTRMINRFLPENTTF